MCFGVHLHTFFLQFQPFPLSLSALRSAVSAPKAKNWTAILAPYAAKLNKAKNAFAVLAHEGTQAIARAYGATASYMQLPCTNGNAAPCVNGSTHELSFSKNGKHLWITQMIAQKVYHFDVVAGNVVESSRKTFNFPMQPHGIVADGDNAWATLEVPTATNALIKIDANGMTLQQINLASGTGPHGLAKAGDGMLWFAGKEGSVVGSANPETGQVTYYPLASNSTPIYIHAAKNGDIWFTELTASKIGRIREGQLTEIDLPIKNSRPISIETSATGSVYVTLEAANSMGYIPSKEARGPSSGLRTEVIKQIFVGTPGVKPAGGAFTPTGQFWFGASAADEMIKLPAPFVLLSTLIQIEDDALIQIPEGTSGSTYHRAAYMGHKMFWTELSTDRVGYLKGAL